MPKSQNQLPTEPLRISTTRNIVEYLKQLVSTGLYGRHHTEAAERLIARGIEGLLKEGRLTEMRASEEITNKKLPKRRKTN